MRLKKLQLQGYKTFATRTEFEFDSGITAVVGPNGSGKSNIADAIRWVLGEQSYSTLRGKRTTDMIFAGSQTRARAGMAQAVLTLDNTDNWLPIDFAEVEIGRRAYRSGENEYLINGQKVRLRDVQDLLATSGLAERTYTIIGQGLIDQALSLRAEERRALFEEAAGVSHYQARRAETLRRLQETQHNIERVHDILSEIRPRLGTLKRQAARAKTYEQVEVDLRHLLRIWYGHQWEQRKEALKEQRAIAQDAEEAWRASRDEIAASQESLANVRRQIESIQRQLGEHRSRREQLREQREAARREVAVLSERRSLLRRQASEAQEELERLAGQREVAQAAVDEALSSMQAAREELKGREETLERFNVGFEAQQAEIDQWSTASARLQKERDDAQQRLAQMEGMLGELRDRLQEQNAPSDDGDEIAALEERIEAFENKVQTAEEQLAQLNEERQELRARLDTARREQQAALKSQRANNEAHAAWKERVARLESRCDLLDQLRDQKLIIDEGVSVVGRLAALLEISSEHQVALESALGARLNTVIVEDISSLQQLMSAEQHSQTFFVAAATAVQVQASSPPANDEGIIGRGIDFVSATDEVLPLARLLLEPVVLVDSPEAAWRIGQKLSGNGLAVAPNGLIVHAGGLVEVSALDVNQSIVAREEAWRAATKELDDARKEAARARQIVEEQLAAIEAHEKTLGQISRDEQHVARRAQEAAHELNHLQRELDRANQRRSFIVQQMASRQEDLQRLEQRIERIKGEVAEKRSDVVRLESAFGDARMRLEALPVAEVEEQRRARRQDIEAARTIVAGRQAVVESRGATLQQIDAQIRRLEDRGARFSKEKEQLDLSQAEEHLEQLQAAIEGIDTQVAPLTEKRKALQESFSELEEQLDKDQRKAHDLETRYTQMNVALSQRENQLDGLIERIRADLGLVALHFDEDQGGQTPLPIDEVVDRLPDVEELPENIEKDIQELRSQLHRIGSVNPDAPQEFEETQERFDFLTQQIEDLTETEKRLRRVIADLDDLTSRAFADTVEKVDGLFAKLFERLFGGGSAQLVLTEPDDLTISGVDIICRLPNRRQQRLALLSGGERSLTATALIFALLKVAPPPFCVMDEVDAMLDEANINRFRGVLRDLSQNSQFIVITHNRGTVQAARTVYGISMGSDSASQVISLRPEEYVNGEK